MITRVVFPAPGLSTALRMCWLLRFPQMWELDCIICGSGGLHSCCPLKKKRRKKKWVLLRNCIVQGRDALERLNWICMEEPFTDDLEFHWILYHRDRSMSQCIPTAGTAPTDGRTSINVCWMSEQIWNVTPDCPLFQEPVRVLNKEGTWSRVTFAMDHSGSRRRKTKSVRDDWKWI